MTKLPRTIPDLRTWLTETVDLLDSFCAYADPCEMIAAAEIVKEADRLICRFGGGHLVGPEPMTIEPRDALVHVGKLLAWAERELTWTPSRRTYFDAVDACNYLGITEDSLYGLVEREHLVPLRGPRRSYRFTQEQLDDYLAQDS